MTAKGRGEKFEGGICSRHPWSRIRYTRNNNCVLCSHERAEKHRNKVKEEAKRLGVSINSLIRKSPRKSYYVPVAERKHKFINAR